MIDAQIERLRAEVAHMKSNGWGAAVVGSPTLERDQAANVAYMLLAALDTLLRERMESERAR